MDTLEALHAQGVDLTGIQAALQRLLDEHGLDDGRRYSCPLTASTRAIGALYIGRRRQAWDRVAHLNSSALGCASADTADEDTTAMVWAVLQDEVGMLSF